MNTENTTFIARVHALKHNNTESPDVALIETEVSKGIGIHLVGLRDDLVKESLLRVVTALQANGFSIPGQKIVINISPSQPKMSSTDYDLPIALSLIRASGQDSFDTDDNSGNLIDLLEGIDKWLVAGELGLDGSIRPVDCCEQAVKAAIASGCKHVLIPEKNAEQIRRLFTEEDIPIYGAAHLREAIALIAGCDTYAPTIWDIQVGQGVPQKTKKTYLFSGSLSVLQILEDNGLKEVISEDMTKEQALAAAKEVIRKEFEREGEDYEYELEVDIVYFRAEDDDSLMSAFVKFFDEYEEEKDFEQYDGSGDAQGYTTVSFTKDTK